MGETYVLHLAMTHHGWAFSTTLMYHEGNTFACGLLRHGCEVPGQTIGGE